MIGAGLSDFQKTAVFCQALNRAIEFSHQLNYFYEKAIYFAVVGHEGQQISAPDTKEGVFDKIFEGFKHWIVVQ